MSIENLENKYINRELSWIQFNQRVLLTGMEKDYKVLDKIKFCSIFSNNLDEFFMVRVASLKAQADAEIQKHVALHKISSLQSEFKELEAELVKKYGDNVTINLETGEIKENVEDK